MMTFLRFTPLWTVSIFHIGPLARPLTTYCVQLPPEVLPGSGWT